MEVFDEEAEADVELDADGDEVSDELAGSEIEDFELFEDDDDEDDDFLLLSFDVVVDDDCDGDEDEFEEDVFNFIGEAPPIFDDVVEVVEPDFDVVDVAVDDGEPSLRLNLTSLTFNDSDEYESSLLDLEFIETSDDSLLVVVAVVLAVLLEVDAVVDAVSSVVEFDVADLEVETEVESFDDLVESGDDEDLVDVVVAVVELPLVESPFVESGDAMTEDDGVDGGDGEESDSEKSIFLPLIDLPFGDVFDEIVDGEAVNSNELVFESGLPGESSVDDTVSLDFVEVVVDVEIVEPFAVFVCEEDTLLSPFVDSVAWPISDDDDLLWLRRSLLSMFEISDVVFVLSNKSEAVCLVVPAVDKSVKSSLWEFEILLFFLSETEELVVVDDGDPAVVEAAVVVDVDAVADSESSLDWSENETSVDELDPAKADPDFTVDVVDIEEFGCEIEF